MKIRKIIIGVVVIIAFIGLILIIKSAVSKKMPKKALTAAAAKKAPVKKVISKGKGALTVRILNSKNTEVPMKVKVFKVADGRSSVYISSTVGGRTQELLPGTYDIEIDTVPQRIYKNIKVEQGREALEDLGSVTGSLIIKTVNAKKLATHYPLRILFANTDDMVTAYVTNKAIDIIPGVYDIEVGTSPRVYKKDIKIDAGKENMVDMGCLTGTLVVKVTDEDKKDVRCGVRVTRAPANEIISSTTSNKPIDLGKGSYNIEIMSYPKQSKKDVKINIGEESVIEFTVAKPVAPQKPIAAAPKTAAPRPQPIKVPSKAAQQ